MSQEERKKYELKNDSLEQKKHKEQNDGQDLGGDENKKLNGPNRPSTS